MKCIRRAGALVGLASALGCAAPSEMVAAESSSDGDATVAASSGGPVAEPRIELGTGEMSFEVLPAEGATLPVIAGNQGGWHVTTAVQFHGFDPTNLSVRTEATALDGDETRIAFPHALLLTEGRISALDGHVVLVGDRVVFDIERVTDVVGRELRLEASIELDGVRLTDVQHVTVVEQGAP